MTATDDAGRTTATLARGGVLSLLGTAITTVAAFALTILVARGIPDTELAGAFFSAIALFTIVSKVAMLGANTGLVRFLAGGANETGVDDDARHLLRVAVVPVAVVAVALAVGGWFGSGALADLLASPAVRADFAGFVRRFSLFLPFATLAGVYLGATRGWSTMLPTTLYEGIVQPVGQLVLVGVVFALALGPQAAALAYWSPMVVVLVLAAVWTHRRLPPAAGPRRVGDQGRWPVFWGFALPRAAARIFSFLLARLDVLMLGALASSAAAGIYTGAIRFVGVGLAVQWALYQPMEPEIARLLQHHGQEDQQRQFHVMTCWTVLVTWPVLLTLMIHGRPLLRLLGPEYVEGYAVLLILSATLLVATAIGGIEVILIMAGYTGWSLANVAMALAVNVGLNLVLIPRMGIEGAALAWSASIVLNNVVPLLQVRRWVGIQPFSRQMLLAMAVSVASFGAVGIGAREVLGDSLVAAVGAGLLSLALYALLALRWRSRLRVDDLIVALRPGGRGAQGSGST